LENNPAAWIAAGLPKSEIKLAAVSLYPVKSMADVSAVLFTLA
jgi:hypothetical protein